MSRTDIFGMRLSEEERGLLISLSKHLHRNQSDTIRWLIYESANELGIACDKCNEFKDESSGQPLASPFSTDYFVMNERKSYE